MAAAVAVGLGVPEVAASATDAFVPETVTAGVKVPRTTGIGPAQICASPAAMDLIASFTRFTAAVRRSAVALEARTGNSMIDAAATVDRVPSPPFLSAAGAGAGAVECLLDADDVASPVPDDESLVAAATSHSKSCGWRERWMASRDVVRSIRRPSRLLAPQGCKRQLQAIGVI